MIPDRAAVIFSCLSPPSAVLRGTGISALSCGHLRVAMSVVFNQGQFCHPRDIWQISETCLAVATGVGGSSDTGIYWVETRAATKHLTGHTTTSSKKICLVPDGNSAEVEKPWAMCSLLSTSHHSMRMSHPPPLNTRRTLKMLCGLLSGNCKEGEAQKGKHVTC